MSMENCARHQEAHEAFNRRDMEACMSFMSDDCSFYDCGREITISGKSEIGQWLQGWVDMLDGRVTKPFYLDAGDYSVCMFTAAGVGPKGEVTGPYCEVAHFTNGKIDSASLYYDQLSLLTKMGVMEAPANVTA
ncbi:MAG TPA: nuclear transport factor 2 family protein [Actinomycetota bacterium]|nr:nuclear transport factor 2 family protein [Actinomycetota bacterium]